MLPNTHDRGLFFFHNPKAGGTSVARALESMFVDVERCPLIENSQRDHDRRHGDYAAFRGYRYYGGHYGHDIFSVVTNDSHCAVTNFRDPAERLLSLYNYYRLDVTIPKDPSEVDNYYAVMFAQQVDFHRFVSTEDPRIEIHTRNHHTRQLTNSGWVSECALGLTYAVAMLKSMPWFYICERPELSMRWARQVFGHSFPVIPRENVTSREKNGRFAVTDIEPATRRIIYEKNVLDETLRARAVRRMQREA
ncbi:MAG: hypothetical protein ABI389_13570 [Rhodanobacter sp.]